MASGDSGHKAKSLSPATPGSVNEQLAMKSSFSVKNFEYLFCYQKKNLQFIVA